MADRNMAPIHELFVFETMQLIEQMEKLVLDSENDGGIETSINEAFRIMHTIKGSAAMMLFNDISLLAHTIEDVLFHIRENSIQQVDYGALTDIVLEVVDYIKGELFKIQDNTNPDGDSSELTAKIREFLSSMGVMEKQKSGEPSSVQQKYYIGARKETSAASQGYQVDLSFDDDCGMENIRSFTLIHALQEIADEVEHEPRELLESEESSEIIKEFGLKIQFKSDKPMETLRAFFDKTMFLKQYTLEQMPVENETNKPKCQINLDDPPVLPCEEPVRNKADKEPVAVTAQQAFISVHVSKMDFLMDLVGELVISEAMVTRNPELAGLQLDGFYKATRQLRKIISELQDVAMSMRMVPLAATFQKMQRIVRDTARKLNREVELVLIGEETEVDKNIIEHITDPLMHLIRNSIDHGIETAEERTAKGKPALGRVTLEAKNAGGEVLITVKDNGKGLDKSKILAKAKSKGLLPKTEHELTDKEIFSLIFLPGFSTKENITEVSGRGVGMDVVASNVDSIGGSIIVDSVCDEGTTIAIKIPLTLAIINGMIIKAGNSTFTVPTTAIREAFRVGSRDIIRDTDNNEIIFIRGKCYPVLRLHQMYNIKNSETQIDRGIIVMVDDDDKSLCLFADGLLGEQQVVVKPLPKYIKKVNGIAGCTLLGDGSISLIIDVAGITRNCLKEQKSHENF